MKYIILMAALLLCGALSAQEEISRTITYVPYEDTLFIAKEVVVINEGLDGINDTIVNYIPPALDSAGLKSFYVIAYKNNANSLNAKLRNANPYRRINADKNVYESLLAGLGESLDSTMVADYSRHLLGSWKHVDSGGSERFFELIAHPNNPERLRMDETGGVDANLNVTIESRWSITVNDGGNTTYNWNGEDRNRSVWQLEKWSLPGSATGGFDNERWIKLTN